MGQLRNILVVVGLMTILSCLVAARDFAELRHLKASSSPDVQAQAARDLIGRLIPDRASDFIVQVDESIGPKDRDTFKLLSSANGQLQITGTSGVAVAMGFYHYLKYFCNGQRTWAGQQTQLPPSLPLISTPLIVTSNDKFRYYQNVCTLSYTMAFWQWDRWEQEIDWMALHGINLPLAFIGQEAIFQRVYMNLGFTQAELDEYFAGPAFLAWGRMGNIHGWGGPLPQMWITNKLVLQHQILERMRSLGMIPVLPAFAGHVPNAIKRVFPQANVTRLPKWSHFNETYSANYLLDFQDPLFLKIGQLVIQELVDEYGTDHIYNTDTFNEMEPASKDPQYINIAGKSVFNGMLAGDQQAVWLMQGWLFLHASFWQPEQVKALVTSVPQGRMIILDLASETTPVYQKHQSYYGQPFIWCMLHNFGGTMELYGAVDSINQGPFAGRAFPNSTMIGIGLTPEGIHQNEVMYEFMMENSWRTAPRNVTDWAASFTQQRYGSSNKYANIAWNLLLRSVYNATDAHREHNTIISYRRPDLFYSVPQLKSVYNATDHRDFDYVLITQRPSLTYDIHSDVWYKPEDLFTAWDNMLLAVPDLEGSSLFQYDLVDVTRDSLQLVALTYYKNLVNAFSINNTALVIEAGNNITDLLADLDQLLSSNERFLLGPWILDAKSWATDANETKLLEYNARNQITLWGPNGEIHDYASKQWAGVTADYYRPRWLFFTQWLLQLLQNGTKWNPTIFGDQILANVEKPWASATYPYPTVPTGSSTFIARELHAKYRPVSKSPFFKHLGRTSRKWGSRNRQLISSRKFYQQSLFVKHFSVYSADENR